MTAGRDAGSRRLRRTCAVLALVLACGESPPSAVRAVPTTNVVIFLVDTLRADRLGVYGYPRPTSPALDLVAAEGVVFQNAYAPASWTLPSVVSIMTATFPCEHRVLVGGQKLDASLEPLASRLGRLGYATASFFANAHAGSLSGLDRGFDVARLESPVDPGAVMHWLDARDPEQPYFLYVHTVQPHDPYRAPARLLESFGGISRRRRQGVNAAMRAYRRLTWADRGAGLPLGSIDNAAEQRAAARRLDSLRDDVSTLYDAEVRRADETLAELIEGLKRRGRWRDTLFVFTSDHGEELGDHGAWQHNHRLYEEVAHVPLVLRLPGSEHAGRRVLEPVTLVDLVPTILDFLGAAGSPARARSLMPYVRGDETPSASGDAVFTTVRINRRVHHALLAARHGDVNVAFRQGHFKGIWNVDRDTLELYDLGVDAEERVDLAASGRARERVAAARRAAEAWFHACEDRAVEPQPGDLERVDELTRESLRALGYVD